MKKIWISLKICSLPNEYTTTRTTTGFMIQNMIWSHREREREQFLRFPSSVEGVIYSGKFTEEKRLGEQTRRGPVCFFKERTRRLRTRKRETMSLLYSGACLHIEEFNIDDRLSSISNSEPTIPVFVMKRARKLERNLYVPFFLANLQRTWPGKPNIAIGRRTVPLKRFYSVQLVHQLNDILIKQTDGLV